MAKRILVVDDDEHIRDLVTTALEGEGYEASAVDSAEEAEEVLAAGGIDGIVLDILMPGTDGYAAYERFRHTPATAGIPILFLTGAEAPFSVEKDRAATIWRDHFPEGTTDILYKPFEIDTLIGKLASLAGAPE